MTDDQAMTGLGEDNLVDVLSEFARTMLTDFPIQAILDQLVRRIVDVLPITSAGVTLIAPGTGPRYVAASDEAALRYEHLQTEVDEGPCLVAYHVGKAVAVPDLRQETRFPNFGPAAIEAGLGAVFTFPLGDGKARIGALDLYRDSPGDLDSAAMRAAQTLADVAAAYLLNAQARGDLVGSSERTQRLAAIVESSNDSIVGWSPEGVITSWNAGSERMFGYSPAEAIGHGLELVVPSELLPEMEAVHRGALRGESWPPFDTRRRCRDGLLVDVEVTVSPIRDGDAIVGLSAVARDISQSKLDLQALRRSEARKAAILSSALDAVVTMDRHGRIEDFNAAAERMFECVEEEVRGRMFDEVIVPLVQRTSLRAAFDRYLATGDGPLLGRHPEASIARADGSVFFSEMSITAVEPPGPPLFTAIIRDVTERRAADATRRTLEDRLNQSQRLETVGHLAGGVAHDFNNLLAVILNYATFVEEAVPAGSDVQRDVQRILDATQRAVRLTRQLLMFARRETVDPESLDMNALVQDVHGLLARTLGEQVELVVNLGADLPAIRADKGQVEQVLMNLAVNARDAMPDGGRLTIETALVVVDDDVPALSPNSRPGRYVQLAVSDDGVGMAPDVASQAFDPFFTTKRDSGGTGLGLATVYGIVTEAGGLLQLRSEPGSGTTLEALFPASDTVVAARAAAVEIQAASANAGETILVVEDQEAVREVTVRMLRRNGYAVLEAATGAEAISLAGEHHVDLLFTDVVMPQMSGRQLADHLQATDPSLRVLYTSGYARGVLGQHPVPDQQTLDLIEKPFTELTLLARVRRAIG